MRPERYTAELYTALPAKEQITARPIDITLAGVSIQHALPGGFVRATIQLRTDNRLSGGLVSYLEDLPDFAHIEIRRGAGDGGTVFSGRLDTDSVPRGRAESATFLGDGVALLDDDWYESSDSTERQLDQIARAILAARAPLLRLGTIAIPPSLRRPDEWNTATPLQFMGSLAKQGAGDDESAAPVVYRVGRRQTIDVWALRVPEEADYFIPLDPDTVAGYTRTRSTRLSDVTVRFTDYRSGAVDTVTATDPLFAATFPGLRRRKFIALSSPISRTGAQQWATTYLHRRRTPQIALKLHYPPGSHLALASGGGTRSADLAQVGQTARLGRRGPIVALTGIAISAEGVELTLGDSLARTFEEQLRQTRRDVNALRAGVDPITGAIRPRNV